MKFQLAINLERLDESLAMDDVACHTLEMVQMAEAGGFTTCLLYTSPSPRDRG